MSLLRADKIANRFNNTGPIIVGPSTVSGNFTVTGITTVLGLGVTNNVLVGNALTANYITANNGANLFNSSLTGITTAGIVTGATYYGNGVNLVGVVTSIAPGPGVQISPISGQGRVTISATGVAVAGYATNAGLTTDLKGGVAGAVPYQIGPNDTGFTAAGTSGEILQSTGAGAPIWTSLASINVSYADSAGISTNLFGGSAGRIPYQTGIDATGFIPVGSSGRILLAQGTGAPTWIDPKASLHVSVANSAGITTSLENGYISNASSMEVVGVTTLGITTALTLDVTGITTTNLLNVSTAATITNLTLSTGPGVAVTAILDEDDMVSNRADALATQQSIRAYVDATRTGIALTFDADTGGGTIDLDEETFTIEGTTNEIYTIGAGNAVTVGLDTNVTIPNNLVVSGFSSLSGLTTITGQLGVSGITTTQFLDVTGVATAQFLEVTGVSTIATLGVSGVTTTQFLEVSGVSTFNNNIDMEGDIIFGTQGDKLIFTSSNFPASGGSIEIATNGANYATIAGNSKQLRIFNDTDSAYSIDMRAGKYSWKDENADYYASCSNGSVKLYHPGTSGGILDQKFETTGAGVTVTGTAFSNQLNVSGVSTFQDHVVIGDGKSIQIGPTGDQLSLEYDSAGLGLIRQNNNLFLLSPTITVGNLDSSKTSAAFSPTGSVELYHNNSLKFTTQNTGVTVTGNVNATTATFTGTGAVGLNTGTTAQRPASPDAGMIRYNSENEQFEGYSSSWGSLGGASGSGGDAVFYENDNTVTTSYTITSGKNAMSAGPITINAGATVTIPAGSVWTIV